MSRVTLVCSQSQCDVPGRVLFGGRVAPPGPGAAMHLTAEAWTGRVWPLRCSPVLRTYTPSNLLRNRTMRISTYCSYSAVEILRYSSAYVIMVKVKVQEECHGRGGAALLIAASSKLCRCCRTSVTAVDRSVSPGAESHPCLLRGMPKFGTTTLFGHAKHDEQMPLHGPPRKSFSGLTQSKRSRAQTRKSTSRRRIRSRISLMAYRRR